MSILKTFYFVGYITFLIGYAVWKNPDFLMIAIIFRLGEIYNKDE